MIKLINADKYETLHIYSGSTSKTRNYACFHSTRSLFHDIAILALMGLIN